jgi:hypothetical protein
MTISKLKYFISFLAIAVLLSACSDDDDDTVIVIPEGIPAEIIIDEPGLHPSKFDFDPSRNLFIVGSVAASNVGHIDPMTGEYTVFIQDDNFSTVPEVFVDAPRNRILVSSGDLGVSANSMNLFSYAYFEA